VSAMGRKQTLALMSGMGGKRTLNAEQALSQPYHAGTPAAAITVTPQTAIAFQ
jgi:hypothetical protein